LFFGSGISMKPLPSVHNSVCISMIAKAMLERIECKKRNAISLKQTKLQGKKAHSQFITFTVSKLPLKIPCTKDSGWKILKILVGQKDIRKISTSSLQKMAAALSDQEPLFKVRTTEVWIFNDVIFAVLRTWRELVVS
jgi:hypothetical protein